MAWIWAMTDHCGVPVLADPLGPGRVAFVDGGAEPMRWGRSYQAVPGIEQRAAAELVATATASVAAADLRDGRAVQVTGQGLLAYIIRGLLPATGASEVSAEADVVIETTGSPLHIGEATRTLRRLGRLVLAAPPRPDIVDLATYRDIHVRGLTLVGVTWASGLYGLPEAIDDALRRLDATGRATDALWLTVDGRGQP